MQIKNLLNIFKEKPVEAPRMEDEMGESGTTIYNGFISGEEYNGDLAGTAKFTIYDKMRKGDSSVATSLKVVKLPLRSANWYVEPASEDKQDVEIAKFIEHNLKKEMSITWDDFLRQALLMLDYGVFIFEKVFTYVEYEGKQYIGWKKFAPRHPRTVTKWAIKKNGDGIVQQKIGGGEANIPMEKLLVFVNEKEGDNWEGISLLRTAYKHWFFKDIFEQIDAMAFERQGLGVPYCKVPKGANAKDKANAKTLVQNLRANEKAYAVFPDGWEIGFLDMNSKSTRDPKESIMHHQRSIVLNVLAQFLMLGASQGSGSKALSADHSDLFFDSLQAIAKQILDVINKYAIKQLVDINFPGLNKYPLLKIDDIGSIDKKAFSDMIKTLTDSGSIEVDEELEKHIRRELNLPEKTEEQLKKKKVEKKEKVIDEKKEKKEKKEAKEDTDEKKNLLNFKEDFKPRRKLTYAEKKVNFTNLKKEFVRSERELEKILNKAFNEQKDEILANFQKAVKAKDYKLIEKISLSAPKEYKKELLAEMKGLYNFGKNTASAEMKIITPSTPIEEVDRLKVSSEIITGDHENKIMTSSKIEAINDISKGKSTSETMKLVKATMITKASELAKQTGSIIAGGMINDGRRLAQQGNKKNIYALQRSELLDDRTCNFCESMDGRIVKLNDPWGQEGAFHSNCRGIWVEIMNTEPEKPTISGVPRSIAKRYNKPNDFKQLKSPVINKDSLAADEIKKQYAKDIKIKQAKINKYEKDGKYPNRVSAHKKEIDRMNKVLNKLK